MCYLYLYDQYHVIRTLFHPRVLFRLWTTVRTYKTVKFTDNLKGIVAHSNHTKKILSKVIKYTYCIESLNAELFIQVKCT